MQQISGPTAAAKYLKIARSQVFVYIKKGIFPHPDISVQFRKDGHCAKIWNTKTLDDFREKLKLVAKDPSKKGRKYNNL